jgi:hypothetical protein
MKCRFDYDNANEWVGQVVLCVQKILLGQHSSFTNELEASVKKKRFFVLCLWITQMILSVECHKGITTYSIK